MMVRGVVRGFLLRFAIVLGVLVVYPFPIGTIPKTEWLGRWLYWPLGTLGEWFTATMFDPPEPSLVPGSGDRLQDYSFLLLLVTLAFVGALLWSLLDRKRTRYPRLEAAVLIGLRYTLAVQLLGYGFDKVFKAQMPDLRPGDLDTPLGELSPMGLAWAFIGASTPYSIFAGLSEVAAGVLLLWRRTQTIGALVAIAVFANVVALNFCFDVPVKLYSAQLLLTAIVLVLPFARRLLAAAMGHAVAELPRRARISPRWELARWGLAIAVLSSVAIDAVHVAGHKRNDHRHELYGSWLVDEVAIDGVTRPPLTSDTERWSRVLMSGTGVWMVSMQGQRQAADLDVDAAKHTMQLTFWDAAGNRIRAETWSYDHGAPDQLVLDGARGAQRWHVTLHRAPPPLLLTRGFHWISPVPFRARDRKL